MYHGSIKLFEKFVKPKDLDKNSTQNGIFFTNDKDTKEGARWYSELRWGRFDTSKIYPAMLNALNLKETGRNKVERVTDEDLKLYIDQRIDAIESRWTGDAGRDVHELAIFEPKQIHILGSEDDVRGFDEFLNNGNNDSLVIKKG